MRSAENLGGSSKGAEKVVGRIHPPSILIKWFPKPETDYQPVYSITGYSLDQKRRFWT